MKITHLFGVCFCLFACLAKAQEGIWSVEKLPQIKEKLIKAGLKLDIKQIYREKQDKRVEKPSDIQMTFGVTKTAPFDSSICLNEAILDMLSGNASLVSSSGLALGVIAYDLVPDTLLELIDPRTGVWVAKPNEEFNLAQFYAKSVAYTFDLNKQVSENNISYNVLHKYYSARQVKKQEFAHRYSQNNTPFYSSDYYYRNEEALGIRTLSKVFRDVDLVALIEEPLLMENSDQLIAIFRLNANQDNRPTLAPLSTNRPYYSPHFLTPFEGSFVDSFHLVMGFPDESYFHLNSYLLKSSQRFIELFRSLKSVLSKEGFEEANSFYCGCDTEAELKQGIGFHSFIETIFQNNLERNTKWKQDYGELLNLMKETYEKQAQIAPSIIYTNLILEYESNFLNSVEVLRDWRIARKENLQDYEKKYYINRLSSSPNPAFNFKLLARLFEFYFTKVPPGHISPYALQQLDSHNNNCNQLVNELFAKSPLADSANMIKLLKQQFYPNMEKFANDPALILLDSMDRFYEIKVKQLADEYEAYADHYNELFLEALNVVLHRTPQYPDADRSLRVSYGKLNAGDDPDYLYTNAHLLPSHVGSPVINNQGKIVGIIGAFGPESYYNMYDFDVKRSSSTIIHILSILNLLSQHPEGKHLLEEIGK